MKDAGISTGSMTAAFAKVPEPVEGPTVEDILRRFNTHHFLPEPFERILKNRLHVGLDTEPITR